MAKKKEQIPAKTCSDCVHEFACQMWNVGNIHNMGAERCSNHETVKESPAYLVGLIDGRAEKKTNADRIRSMSDEQLAEWLCSLMTAECCDQRCPARDICNLGDNGLVKWMKQPAEEE